MRDQLLMGVLLLIGWFQLGVQASIILLLFKMKINYRQLALFSTCIILFHQVPVLLFFRGNVPVSVGLYFLILFVVSKFILRLGIVKSILATGIIHLIATMVEYVGMAIFKLIYSDIFNNVNWTQSVYTTIVMRFFGTVLCLIIALGLAYFNLHLDIPAELSKKRRLSIIISILLSTVIVTPNIIGYFRLIEQTDYIIFLFNIVSLLVIVFYTIYSTNKFTELDAKSQQLAFQDLYIQNLDNMVQGLRSFKHDFNNIITVLQGYIKLNDFEGLKRYFTQINSDVRVINNYLPLNQYLRNNPAVYGIFLNKMSIAELKDISFELNISCEVKEKNIRNLDLCKILGIFLDNAIEAASTAEKKLVFVNIYEADGGKSFVIEVSNAFDGKVNIGNIFESGYTTKPEHMGFGLWEVRNIVEKYKAYCTLDTYAVEDILTQKLKIAN